eukprot:TRINITY_DN2067_c0_g1_i1.p1 TRINITY_DN2067_c0_g1~~TRINITY_DN2067_c0_g1_i1.p1  ORF type:complete len:351 (-),score=57.77 TRINITY_DN2067_c0_g1_i1:235-1287(-)
MALFKAALLLLLSCCLVQNASSFWYGHDISSILMLENSGQTYKDLNGVVRKSDAILQSGGMNSVRSRIWVNPKDGNYNLDYNLRLAKRVKAAGLSFYLDFHYSDTWADPSHQTIPAGWPNTLDPLLTQVYNYTKATITAFINQGTPVDIVSLGNEIRNGLLWPVGTTSSFSNIAKILNATAYAVKDASGNNQPKIMIHIDNGWNIDEQTYFYDSVQKTGAFSSSLYDIQGVSYYPFYGTGATLANLKVSLNTMVSKYAKDIVVAETNWPWNCPGVTLSEKNIPISPAGQITWVDDVITILNALPSGHGKGVYYWEPAWIGNAGLGSSCVSNLLFNNSGSALPSVNMYGSH